MSDFAVLARNVEVTRRYPDLLICPEDRADTAKKTHTNSGFQRVVLPLRLDSIVAHCFLIVKVIVIIRSRPRRSAAKKNALFYYMSHPKKIMLNTRFLRPKK